MALRQILSGKSNPNNFTLRSVGAAVIYFFIIGMIAVLTQLVTYEIQKALSTTDGNTVDTLKLILIIVAGFLATIFAIGLSLRFFPPPMAFTRIVLLIAVGAIVINFFNHTIMDSYQHRTLGIYYLYLAITSLICINKEKEALKTAK